MSYLFRSTGAVVGITSTQCVLQNLLKTWLTQRIHGPNADYVPILPLHLQNLMLVDHKQSQGIGIKHLQS